jgi:transcriptional regulator of acetoin/glycerol metabolism
VDVDDLPENLQKPSVQAGHAGDSWRPIPLEEVRRQHIRRVLDACEGNRVRAAQMLGIGRTSLYRFLKRAEKKSANTARL